MSARLEQLYQDAKSALKVKDYDRAAGLLKQILAIDENYKDASRLLAQTVRLKRRHWYTHPLLWSMIGLTILAALGIFIAPRMKEFIPVQPSTTAATVIPTATLPLIAIPTATETLLPAPTPLPLTWKRISVGQEFPRDVVTAFVADRNDPDVIYASLLNAGIYKTIDGGLSWKPAHHGLSNTQVVSLVIDFQNPNILYAGTMDGIYKTEDGGGNWSRIGDGTYLLMDYQDSSHLYARDENGIYETTDQGRNWEIAHSLGEECPTPIHSWVIHPLDGKVLFVGSGGGCAEGVFQSDDNGRTWRLIEMKGEPDVTGLAIGLDQQKNLTIFASTSSIYFEYRGTFASDDNGESWRKLAIACGSIFTDPDNPSLVYCPRSGLWATEVNGGSSIRLGLNTMELTTIHIAHVNDRVRLIAGGIRHVDYDDEGIFISRNGGGTWVRQSNGLASARAELKLDPLDNKKIYLAAYYSYIPYIRDFYESIYTICALYRSLDSGTNWEQIISAAGWCGPAFDGVGNFYLDDSSALQMTWDGGDHWLWDGPGFLGPYGLPIPSQSVSANPFIDGLIYAIGEEIYYSEHAGRLWQPASGSAGLWDAKLFYADQGQTVYAIGRYHQISSADGGRTWQNCGIDLTTSRTDTRLALDPQGTRLYLATPGQGVFISTDSCGSWQESNKGLGNLFINTLAIDPNKPETIYSGTDSGAYVSFDSGASWNEINDGLLGATVVYSIAVDKDSNVYAATPYGIFKLESK